MLPKKLKELLDDLDLFPDRAERIEALVSLSSEYSHPTHEEVPRTEDRRVPGCESEVFLDVRPGQFRFAVDNPQGISAMSLAVILERGLQGEPPEIVKQISEDIVFQVFGRELSMGKSLGLTNMIRMLKAKAGCLRPQ